MRVICTLKSVKGALPSDLNKPLDVFATMKPLKIFALFYQVLNVCIEAICCCQFTQMTRRKSIST